MIPTISHWIGQDYAIRRLKVALEAPWNDGTKLPHMLFVGSAGTGKTLLSGLAAKEMGAPLHERLAQVMDVPGALNGLLLQAKDKDIIFLDEIHLLDTSAQTLLYRAMEGGQISVRTGMTETLNMPLNDFTIIGATTDEYKLLSPLRQRFKVVIPFSTYDDESLAETTLPGLSLCSRRSASEKRQLILRECPGWGLLVHPWRIGSIELILSTYYAQNDDARMVAEASKVDFGLCAS